MAGQSSTSSYFVSGGRRILQWILAVLFCVLAAVFIAASATGLAEVIGFASVGAVVSALFSWLMMTAFAALLVRVAVVHTGPVIVFTKDEARLRDVFGWVRVPWASVTGIEPTSKGFRLRSAAVRINRRRMRRRFAVVPAASVVTDGADLLAEAQSRVAAARGVAERQPN